MKKTEFLNNLRWMTVVLVVIYHVCYVYNSVGVPGGLPDTKPVPFQSLLLNGVYPWFMVLLYVVSGICAWFALQHHSVKEWLKSRTVKLLIPSTLGLLTFQWITGLLNMYYGGGLSYIPAPLVYPIAALSGTGPLWFVQLLFVYCLILGLVHKFFPELIHFPDGVKGAILLWLGWLPLWGASFILNAPVLTIYRFGIYLFCFLAGYYVFANGNVLEMTEKYRIWYGLIALASGIFYLIRTWGTNYAADAVLENWLTNLFAWSMVLFLLGFFRKRLNFENPFLSFMNRNSYNIYILHYVILMLVCPFLQYSLHLGGMASFLIAGPVVLLASIGLGLVIEKIPILRTLILGLPWKRKNPVKHTSKV